MARAQRISPPTMKIMKRSAWPKGTDRPPTSLIKPIHKDYAILYRGNHQSRVALKDADAEPHPVQISGGASFFSRPEIKDLLAYLRVLTNPDDDSAFLRIVNTPKARDPAATLQSSLSGRQAATKACSPPALIWVSARLTGRGYESLLHFTHWLHARSATGRT